MKSLLQVSSEHSSDATAPPFDASHVFNSDILPVPSHSTVLLLAAVSILGEVVSSIVNVAEVVENNPQASVAVKVTKVEPVFPQSSLKVVKSLVQVTPAHSSEATAPPLAESQVFNSDVLPVPSHSTVLLLATVSILGAVVSSIVKVACVLITLPLASVNVNVTVSKPVVPQSLLIPILSLVTIGSEQLSVPVKLDNQSAKSSVLPLPSHSTVKLGVGTSPFSKIILPNAASLTGFAFNPSTWKPY